MVKKRATIPLDTEFHKKLSELKKKLMMIGADISLREITRQMANQYIFEDIEKKIMEQSGLLQSGLGLLKIDKRK